MAWAVTSSADIEGVRWLAEEERPSDFARLDLGTVNANAEGKLLLANSDGQAWDVPRNSVFLFELQKQG